MEITQLHYFKQVAEYENFTKAAETLHITQSALSRSIAQLEDDIGFQLFERKGSRIYLNSNGKFFLREVITVLNSLENAVSAAKEMSGLEKGIVRIAVSEAIFIKHLIGEFLKDFPDARISCLLLSDEQIKAGLNEGTLNFAIAKKPISGPELVWQPLFEDRMMVVFPREHPLASRESIYLSELVNEKFIISNIGYNMDSQVIDICARAGFTPYIVYEGAGEDLAGKLVAENIGVMIAPYSTSYGVTLFKHDSSPEVGVPIMDSFSVSEVGVVMKRGLFQSVAALTLYDRIVEHFKTIPPLEISQ